MKCTHPETSVLETRKREHFTYRLRRCLKCSATYSTREYHEDDCREFDALRAFKKAFGELFKK